MNSQVDYKFSLMPSTTLFDILNIICKRVAVSGECNELIGQNQSKLGLTISSGIALGTSETFNGSLIQQQPVPSSDDCVELLQKPAKSIGDIVTHSINHAVYLMLTSSLEACGAFFWDCTDPHEQYLRNNVCILSQAMKSSAPGMVTL